MLVGTFTTGVASAQARAETIDLKAGESVAQALSHAVPGDTLKPAAGTFRGDLVIAVPGLTIESGPDTVLQGSDTGDAIRVTAADVTIRGLTIRGSGLSLIDKNSGIFVDRTADRARMEGNRLQDNLIAIYLDGPRDALVRGNHIQGLQRLRVSERGPAVSLWNTPGSQILDNDIGSGRDGVFSGQAAETPCAATAFAMSGLPCISCTPTTAKSPTTSPPATTSATC